MADVPWKGVIVGPRDGDMRARRGRGMRGVRALPGPLSPNGIPTRTTRRAQFERLVADIVTALEPAFSAENDLVEVVVEDTPKLPPEWDDAVPSSVVTHDGDVTRVVLFRMPIVQHARDAEHLEEVTWSVLLQQLAAIWQVRPEDLDPRH